MTKQTTEPSVGQKLHSETALINWRDLQRSFAQGNVFFLNTEQNLVEVATHFARDEVTQIAALLERGEISQPSNVQARRWYEHKCELWAVVITPFVLVQAPQ